jgi:hypothetical protein
VSRSLSDLASFVINAYRLAEPEFKPENIQLGGYTFLPWVRTGVGAAVTAPPDGHLRAEIVVELPVEADGQQPLTVRQSLQVRGPGDVLGVDTRQVIRCYPVPGATDAEDTFLAHIEFDRPEVPWLVSPEAPAADRLRPWLTLVVLTAGRYDLIPGQGGLPAAVSVAKSELQPLDDGFAWAHAQVIGTTNDAQQVNDLLSGGHAPVNLSRLICPRRLVADRDYLACVVPTYDAGVKAGLGDPAPGTLAHAWDRDPGGGDADDRVSLPVYFSWRFSTSATGGDFAALAEKLHGLPAPWQVGRRITDMAKPRGGLPDLGPADQGRLQTVRGPLISPQQPKLDSADPAELTAAAAETATWSPGAGGETELLRGLLNRPDQLAGQPGALAESERPLVGPEIYARFHAAQTRVDSDRDGDWFGQLNLTPANRVAAGLGTRVVQHNQEQLMQSAWAQVGPIDAVNRRLRWAQGARFVGGSIHERHLSPLGYAPLLQVTRLAHTRVRAQPELTVAGLLADSSTADPVATPAFRRATRPLGPLTRFAAGRTDQLTRMLADGDTARDHQVPYRALDGVADISLAAARALDATVVAPALGVDASAVVETLLGHGQTLRATTAIPEALTTEVLAHATPPADFSVSEFAGRAVLDRLTQAAPRDPASDPVRTMTAVALLKETAPALLVGSSVAGPPPHFVSEAIAQDVSALAGRLSIVTAAGPTPAGPGGDIAVVRNLDQINVAIVPKPEVIGDIPLVQQVHPVGDIPLVQQVHPVGDIPLVQQVHPAGDIPLVQQVHPVGDIPVVQQVQPISDKVLARPVLSDVFAASKAVTVTAAAAGFSSIADDLVAADWPVAPVRPTFDVTRTALLDLLDSKVTVTRHIRARVGDLPDWLPSDWFDDGMVQPVMAAPVFTLPMYEALDEYSRDWLLPGLATFPEPDIVTTLVSNAGFIEGFLAGLSHEMARELLWRGYPTDRRGTYFRRFWNPANDELAQDLHRFDRTALGSHLVATLKDRVVLLVKGDLIRRYPDAMVTAMLAHDQDPQGRPQFSDPSQSPETMATMLFHGHLAPDMVLVGFDLTVDQIKAATIPDPAGPPRLPGWWFLVSEHPTAPRFGLKEPPSAPVLARDSLTWADLPSPLGFLDATSTKAVPEDDQPGSVVTTFGRDAASCAHLLLRDPVRAAFEAMTLLTPTVNP